MAKKTVLSPLLDAAMPPAVVAALQALHHGRADEHQQRRAIDWIVRYAARAFSSTFDPDPLTSAFLQGKRQVGLIIINATRTSTEAAQALEYLNQKED